MSDLEMPKKTHIQDLSAEEQAAHFAAIPAPKKITRSHGDLQWLASYDALVDPQDKPCWSSVPQPLHVDQTQARAWLASEINSGQLSVGEYLLVRVLAKVSAKVVTSTKVVL